TTSPAGTFSAQPGLDNMGTGCGGYIKQNVWKPTVRRGPISAEFNSPGPAQIALPSFFGTPAPVGKSGTTVLQHFDSKKSNAPAYSMGTRPEMKPKVIGPGPVYDVSNMVVAGGKVQTPTARLPPKDQEPAKFEKFVTPGPSTYDVTPADKLCYKHSPAWKIKEEQEKKDATGVPKGRVFNESTISPGPVYELPGLTGTKHGVFLSTKASSPAYTLRPRREDPKPSPVPGPGAYKTVETETYKSKAPNYSLSGRTTLPKDKTQKPGPGAHNPEKVEMHLNWKPSFSFGLKHSPYIYVPGMS
ncbi:unnamed protein product, partial [Cyprideis torosa]